jgi:uncharacterized protein with PIN domain
MVLDTSALAAVLFDEPDWRGADTARVATRRG